MNGECIPVPALFHPVCDGMETTGATQFVRVEEDERCGWRGRGDGRTDDHAGLDDLPGADLTWQDRPRPWEYDDWSEYERDLNKFMNEVFGCE